MKVNLKAYMYTTLASGIIGLLVGMTALLVHFYESWMLGILLKAILAGAVIGSVSMGACLLLITNNYRQPVFFLGGVLVIIGVGTASAAKLFGGLPLGKVAILVAVAEFFGMIVAYVNYRRFIYVNEKLREKQKQLREQ